jgi:hypothetical protein
MDPNIKLFNDRMEFFLNSKLPSYLPSEIAIIKEVVGTFRTSQKANPVVPALMFYIKTLKYKQHILDGEEIFFLKHYQSIPLLQKIAFAKHWVQIDQSIKDEIKEHVKHFFVLAEKIKQTSPSAHFFLSKMTSQ